MEDFVRYKSGYLYQTVADYIVDVSIFPKKAIETYFLSLTEDGLLKIKRGYSWDGPSGPAIHTKNFIRGSLIHDALYQLIRLNKLSTNFRLNADKELQYACKKDGMCSLRAWWVYKAVRLFAVSAASPENAKKVLKAP